MDTMQPPSGTVLRRCELMLELWRGGAHLSRLGFLQWLVDHGRDPEWQITPAKVPLAGEQGQPWLKASERHPRSARPSSSSSPSQSIRS